MKIKNKLDVNLYEHGVPEDYLTTSVFLDELENTGVFNYSFLFVDRTDPIRQVEKVVADAGNLSDYTWRKRYWGPFKGMGAELVAIDKEIKR